MLELVSKFKDLKGQSVFITGGGSGIGASLVEGFVSQGAKVAFVDILDSEDFCDTIEKEYDNRPSFIHCDLQDVDALNVAVAQAAELNDAISVLVNNAALDDRHTIGALEQDEWDRLMNINLRPHFFSVKAISGMMKKAGKGSIINYSSISYMMGNAGYPAYLAAKSGINGMTRGLARELGPHGVRVNAVMPGWVITPRQDKLWVKGDALEVHKARQCLPDTIYPRDLVEPTLFLASDASKMMTGQALVIDGGVVVTG